MQTDTSPIDGTAAYPRLGFLIGRFHLAVQRQRQQDTATLASLVRALKRGGPDASALFIACLIRGSAAASAVIGESDIEHGKEKGCNG